jgi:hypothetical protein
MVVAAARNLVDRDETFFTLWRCGYCVAPAWRQRRALQLLISRGTTLLSLMMSKFSKILFLLAAVLLTGTNTIVRAANIQNSQKELCAFSLEGPISQGDAAQLSALVSRSHIDRYDERTSSVCLKSSGGSYAEGLRIAEFVFNHGLSTVIEFGSECYSACAIIFMAGVMPEQIGPMRKLSIGGVLGFHAPYLTMPDQKYSKQQVEDASQSMRSAILGLMQLSLKRTQLHSEEFIKKSLIAKMLEKGPTEIFFVTSISEAARWDIEIYDAADYLAEPNTINIAKNVCNNFHYSNMDKPVAPNTNLSLSVEKYSSKFQKDDYRILVKNAKTNDVVCELYPRARTNDVRVSFFACSYDYWSSKSFGDCREYKTAPAFRVGNFVPYFFKFDPGEVLLKLRN